MNPRHLQTTLSRQLEMFPVVAVLGSRQAGKTTLLDLAGAGRTRFDLELSSDRLQITGDPDVFLRQQTQPVSIDEAQMAPELFPALRVAIDRDRSAKGRYLLTGSSSPQLSKAIAESLAGRIALLELGPFSLAEAYQQPPAMLYQRLIDRAPPAQVAAESVPRVTLSETLSYWFHGGYPEPWLSNDDAFRQTWQRNYIETYLLRDIGALFPNLNRDRFRQFIQLLPNVSGTILNNAEIARTLAVSEPTVRDWLTIAHGTFLWRHIPAWHRSPHKQLVKHPKGYVRDSGLLHRLLYLNDAQALRVHPIQGRSWEGLVVEQLLRGFASLGATIAPYHYRTRGGAEIDLILDGDAGLVPVEIKLASATPRKELTALREFVSDNDCAIGLVINNDERSRQLDDRIVSIPAAAL